MYSQPNNANHTVFRWKVDKEKQTKSKLSKGGQNNGKKLEVRRSSKSNSGR